MANTYFTLNNEVNNCGYYDNSNQNPDTWFQLSGDGKLYDFTFKRPPNSQKFAIFKGNCDSLICVEQFWGLYNEDSVTIRTFFDNQTDYFIKVFNQYSWENRNFEFYFQEVPIASNDKCVNARILTCGDIVIDSLDFAIANDTTCESLTSPYYSTSKGIWYQLEGADKYIEIYFPESNTIPIEFRPSFFEGICGQLNCIDDQLRTYRKKYVFWGELGKTYYMGFQGQQKFKFEAVSYTHLRAHETLR